MVEIRQVVRLRAREEIEEEAWRARGAVGLLPSERAPVAEIIDLVLPSLIDGFEMRVAEEGELGEAEAITDLHRPIITFSPRTYDGLCRGIARPRLTALHEMGHLLMHTRQPVSFAFARRYDPRIDPEWQADTFAAAFAMPEGAFRRVRSMRQAMRQFGVSRNAASLRARLLKMHWLLGAEQTLDELGKRKGHGVNRAP